MYYYGVMDTYITSISSRGLVYIPKKIQKQMKLDKPTRVEVRYTGSNIILEPVKDIMDFAGIAKKKAPKNFDYRKYMEENYKEV